MRIDFELEKRMMDYNCMVMDKICALFSTDNLGTVGIEEVEEVAARMAEADPGYLERLEDELK